jgi:hypothetical protein
LVTKSTQGAIHGGTGGTTTAGALEWTPAALSTTAVEELQPAGRKSVTVIEFL